MRRFNLNLDAAVMDQLETIAGRGSVTALIREAVAQWLEREGAQLAAGK